MCVCVCVCVCELLGLVGAGRASACDKRSANGSADFTTGTAAAGFFLCAGGVVSSLTRPSDVGVSEGAGSDPLPDALRETT